MMEINKYSFKLNIENNLPDYKVSPKIKGIIGYGLKKIYCLNYYIKCEECNLQDKCNYIAIFKPATISKQNSVYTIIYTFKKNNDYFVNITSLNNTISLRDVINSISIMRKNGISNKHLRYKIELGNVKNYKIDEEWLNYRKKEYTSDIWKLKFLSPYINKNGVVDNNNLISSIINRVKFLDENLLNNITKESPVYLELISQKLNYVKNFKSSDIGNNINISGYKGELILKINLEMYLLLKLCEIFHIGKNVSYGCGKIILRSAL